MGCRVGVRAQAPLDNCSWARSQKLLLLRDGAETWAWSLCSGYTAQVWGKRDNLLRVERGLPYVYIIILVCMGVGRGVQWSLGLPGFSTHRSPVHDIFVAAVWCQNAGMVFVLVLEWATRCFKKALDGKPCTIKTQILHRNVSHIV